ncbi:terminase small subunit [Clostridium ganghwense]|uniref:Terminase small subunit n=1 Tax=Clostridium ganghwense TaxID=312089 RepID=A0ABT4CTR8_9CLOT|nr:terminase small subunit [Clostridium ganghwense]MCY6372452.1 terminase small subunit [Clostridium ganghwense]
MSDIRAPDIKKLAEKDYITGMKYKDIATKYNVSLNTVKSWKTRYKWNRKGVHTKEKVCTQKKNIEKSVQEPMQQDVEEVLMNSSLTDKQRLFCHYYLKSFNQTMAAIKAGYSPERAHVTGSELVRNRKVKEEIKKLKGKMTEELFIDAMDVLRKYVEIAFADITDYVEYGKKEIVVDKDEEGNEVKALVNYVDFKDSYMVDGTIIEEVSQGKNGVKIKLHDKMKALEKLEKYFDLFPDKFKRKIEEEKHKMAKYKFEIEKSKLKTQEQPKHNKVTENELKAILEDDEDDD